jgi:polyphosphate kinase 2 (PPK2 family)
LGEQARALDARFDGATAAPGEAVDLSAIPTDEGGAGEREARRRMKDDRREIAELEEMLAAGKTRGVLVVLQGMDSGGKGGATKRPLRLNPAWTRVSAFKKPTPEEATQHFLKRIEAALPQGKPEGTRGWIQIFDRSHYEDLVMPAILGTHSKEEVEARYQQVLDFERRLAEAGVVVVKLFMHISEEEQGRRLQARVDTPEKNYKASPADWEMRKLFPKFQQVWGEVMARTSAPWSIWNVIAADNKPRRDAEVAHIVLKTLKRLNLSWPENPDLATMNR